MPVIVIEPPATIITLEEAKQHLSVHHPDDDELIAAYVATASAFIDGPDGYLGRAICGQTLEFLMPDFCSCAFVKLPIPPLVSVISVKFFDENGSEQTVPETAYVTTATGLAFSEAWSNPALATRPDAVRIRYRAGYGSHDGSVWDSRPPPPIKVAAMMMVAQWYDRREAVVIGASVEAMPFAVNSLLGQYRVYSI